MIEQIDYFVRLISIGAGLMLVAQLVAGEIRPKIKLPVIAMTVGAIGYLLSSTPFTMSPNPIDPLIDLLALSVPFWVWLFGRNLFEKEPPQRAVLTVAAVLLTAWVLGHFLDLLITRRVSFYIIHLVSLGLIADLARVAFTDRADDLVEQRRIIRLWLPLLVAAQAGTVLIAELVAAPADPPAAMRLFNSMMILAIKLFAGLALLKTDPELLVETEEGILEEIEQTPDLNPSEQVLHDKLIAAMEEGAYRTQGLTIAALAEHLDTPEHRLRALINRRLGYRNFSAFLNRHRIAEARRKLSDRDEVDLPVLTIAMDLGYNSLPTFNRAFRSETGTTPSEFRRLAIADGPEDPGPPVEAVQN